MVVSAGVILLSFSGSAQASQNSAESAQHYASAERAIQKSDIGTATIELKNAVRSDPDNNDARYQLALLYLRTGVPAAALAELETVRARSYDEAKLALPLMQCYLALGRFKESLTKVDVTNLKGETRSAVLAAQSRASMALHDAVGARRLSDEALKESPNLASALVASAMLLNSEGKVVDAEAQLAKAADGDAQLDVLLLKGELRQKQNDPQGALKYFNLAVAKAPSDMGARIERAVLNVTLNQLKAVEVDDNAVLAIEPKQPYALYLRAYLLAQDKKFRDAIQILLALPQLLDSYPPAIYLLAATALEDNRFDTALEYSQRYLQKRPDGVAGSRLLALVHQRMNAPATAVGILEPLIARYPNDNPLKLQLAAALLAAGRSSEAVDLFQQGLAVDPGNVQARLALATGELRSGQTDQGVAEIEGIVKSDPGSLQANTLLVMSELQVGQAEKALQTATAMVTMKDADPNAYNLQGTAFLANKNMDGARAAFQTALKRDSKFTPAMLNLARIEERAGNWAAAKQWYEKVTVILPMDMAAYDGLSNLALRNGDVDGAEAYLKQAVARDGAATAPRLRLIDMLLEHKRNEQGLIEARDFVNAAPQSPLALGALGRAQLATGDVVNGIGSYQRLATLIPDDADAQRRLGRVMAMADANAAKGGAGKYTSEARAAFDRAVNIAPDDIAVLSDRLEFERRVDGAKAAVILAQKYADARPNSVGRMIVLGDSQVAADQTSAGVLTYRRVWEKSKSSLTTLRVYAGLMHEEKAEEAMKVLRDWSEKHPTDYEIRFLIASSDIKAGRTEQAIAETEAMYSVFPENPLLLNNLAWLYTKSDAAKAMAFAEKAYALAPLSPDVMDTLGWLYVATSEVVRAEPLLRKAYEAAPARADIGFHYAVALEKNKKGSIAKGVLEKSLAGSPKFAERAEAQAMFDRLVTSGPPK